MKKRTRSTWIALLATVALGLTALPAQAAPPLPGCKNPKAIARYLRLTQEQVAAWRTLREDLREAVEPIREEIAPIREDLGELLDTANPDACTAGGLVVSIDVLADQIGVLHDGYIADFEALLTPEQLEKWERLVAFCTAEDQVPGVG